MRIISLAESTRPKNGLFDLFVPRILPYEPGQEDSIQVYTVQKEQDMRLDSVILAMYEDYTPALESMDIICYINNIDNPLNVYEGMQLIYPSIERLETYRALLETPQTTSKVKELLGVPNKTTRKDENREKFIENNYSLPPVVLTTPKEPVRLVGQNIVMGGI